MPEDEASNDVLVERNVLSPSAVEGTAGFTAGIAGTLVGHPFDLIKIRLQSKA